MTFDEYQEFTRSTAVYPGSGQETGEAVVYTALGLTGEAGEAAEKIKKRIRKSETGIASLTDIKVQDPAYRDEIAKELGDVLWYLARMADEIGMPLSSIAARNRMKLESRKARDVIKGEGDNR